MTNIGSQANAARDEVFHSAHVRQQPRLGTSALQGESPGTKPSLLKHRQEKPRNDSILLDCNINGLLTNKRTLLRLTFLFTKCKVIQSQRQKFLSLQSTSTVLKEKGIILEEISLYPNTVYIKSAHLHDKMFFNLQYLYSFNSLMTQLMTINSASTPEVLVFSSVSLVYRRWDQLRRGVGKQQRT